MIYIIGFIATVFLSIIIFSGCKTNTNPNTHRNRDTNTTLAKPENNNSFTIIEIAKKLKNLKEPSEYRETRSAMCYYTAGPPTASEYICPTCGNKTLYTLEDYQDRINSSLAIDNNLTLYNITTMIGGEIASCHRYIEIISKPEISLDESQFCLHCSPGTVTPQLVLVIKYSQKEHRYAGVTSEDFNLLSKFFEGSELYYEDCHVLDCKKHLAKLLGVDLLLLSEERELQSQNSTIEDFNKHLNEMLKFKETE